MLKPCSLKNFKEEYVTSQSLNQPAKSDWNPVLPQKSGSCRFKAIHFTTVDELVLGTRYSEIPIPDTSIDYGYTLQSLVKTTLGNIKSSLRPLLIFPSVVFYEDQKCGKCRNNNIDLSINLMEKVSKKANRRSTNLEIL